MTTLAIIALTVLGTIVIVLFIIGCIGTKVSIENPKFMDDCSKVTFAEHKELTDAVDSFFEILNHRTKLSVVDYLDNPEKYQGIIDKTPNEFLDFHFQNSIRDEQYELSQYISDVAKERGITLKAELN